MAYQFSTREISIVKDALDLYKASHLGNDTLTEAADVIKAKIVYAAYQERLEVLKAQLFDRLGPEEISKFEDILGE